MLVDLQKKIEDLLDEVEEENLFSPTESGESIEDQILGIKKTVHSIRELHESETV